MTAVVPAAGGEGAAAAATPTEGATTLSDAQRRWCIGAAVVVMGLASLGTALYQSQSSEVDPAAAGELAPLETSSSGSAGGPGAAALPDPSLGGFGMPSPDALAPLSLMPSPGLAGGIPTGAGVPDYVSAAPSQPRVVDSPAAPAPLGGALASPAAPPGASLPAAGAAAPETASGTGTGTGTAAQRRAAGPPGTTGTTGARGVIEVPAGQAPPPGYQRVYPVTPRQQGQAGTSQQRRAPGTATTPGTGRTTTPNGTQRRTPSTTSDDATGSGSGSSTTPSGRTTPRPQQGGLLGGLGGQ